MEMAPNYSMCYGVFFCGECTKKGCIYNSGDKTCLPGSVKNPMEPYCFDNRNFYNLIAIADQCTGMAKKGLNYQLTTEQNKKSIDKIKLNNEHYLLKVNQQLENNLKRNNNDNIKIKNNT